MKSILIIGGLGMLGSQVLKEFVKTKYKIYATYRNNTDLNKFKKNENNKNFNVTFYKFDIKNYKKKDLEKIIYKKDFIINYINSKLKISKNLWTLFFNLNPFNDCLIYNQ